MKILINYATLEFAALRSLNTATGFLMGGFDEVREYSPEDLDATFRKQNAHILKQPRGAGYWLWKPYIILKTLQTMNTDDYLFYSDADMFFTGSVAPVVDLVQRTAQGVIAFRCKWQLERNWTKRDAFVLMGCDTGRYADTFQAESGYSVWRRTAFSLRLAAEWLRWVQDERIVTDIPNRCGKKNFAEFRDHRHDQSVWSLVSKKHGMTLHRQPWREPDREFPASTYPCFVARGARNPMTLLRLWWRHPLRARIACPVFWTVVAQAGLRRKRFPLRALAGGC